MQLQRMGLKTRVLEREATITTGIDLLRQTIGFSAFDAKKCAEGLRCLENYAYEWDDDKGKPKDKPRHDWTSHGADSARYAAIAAPMAKTIGVKKPIPPIEFVGAGWN
jgi:hypothetical protein